MKHLLPRLAAVVCGFGFTGLALAQTYVGNLDGTSIQSTFTTSADGTNALSGFGWTAYSGSARVFGQTGGSSNDAVIGDFPYNNYGVQYDTNTALVAGATYTVEFTMGFVSANNTGSADYNAQLGTWNGSAFTYLSGISGTINRASGPTSGYSFGADGTKAVTLSFQYTAPTSGLSLDDLMVRWDQVGSSVTLNSDFFGVDDVKLSYVSAVPEPSTYAALAGVTALGFAAWRRRRRAAA